MADVAPQMKQIARSGTGNFAERHLIMTPRIQRTVDPDDVRRKSLLPDREKKKK